MCPKTNYWTKIADIGIIFLKEKLTWYSYSIYILWEVCRSVFMGHPVNAHCIIELSDMFILQSRQSACVMEWKFWNISGENLPSVYVAQPSYTWNSQMCHHTQKYIGQNTLNII